MKADGLGGCGSHDPVCKEGNQVTDISLDAFTCNNRKGNKVTERQLQLARKWNAAGLLSDEGLKAVEARAGI